MSTEDFVVNVEQGKLRGKSQTDFRGGNFYSFLGIPYAQPPVGELRFKAPVPAEPWEGIRDATKEANECPSPHMIFLFPVGSEEDCLSLNVHTKEVPKPGQCEILKPVMVWIHGGGFLTGSSKASLTGPDYLMSEDIILVQIQYRLGVFGFLSLDDPSLGVPGNAGLKDMILALKWIQRNIRQFGGDPNNVTIFGESAGGAAVDLLYISPLSRGLFHKAIAQSGSAMNLWARGYCKNGQAIATALGFEETDERKLLQYLRDVSSTKLAKAQLKIPDVFKATSATIKPYLPVIEKPCPGEEAFLAQDPVEILKTGNFHPVPLMTGYNSNEGLFYKMVMKFTSAKITTDFETEISPDLNLEPGSQKSKEVAQHIKKFYYGEENPSYKNLDPLHLLKTDTLFAFAINRSVKLKKMKDVPIYLYRMSLDTSINFFKKFCTAKAPFLFMFLYFLVYISDRTFVRNLMLKLANAIPRDTHEGAAHGDDVGYLFKTFMSPEVKPGSIEHISIMRFVRLWTNFARYGDPTPDPSDELLDVKWDPVTKEDNFYLDIGESLGVGKNPDFERMEFWEALYKEQ